MRIRVLSDLHLERHRDHGVAFIDSLDAEGVDVCVLAGDITSVHRMYEAFTVFCSKFPEVVYVTGNHEYYGSNRGDVNEKLRRAQLKHKNLHVLHRSAVVIQGQRFIGTTLWFPYTLHAAKHKDWLADFRHIQAFKDWIGKENRQNVAFLEQEVVEGDIVVTHHLPSPKSIHPKYQGSPYNCYFLCDMEETILERKPKYWLHGHTHESADYILGETRVVCNPFGYLVIEENPEFNSSLTLTT